MIRQRWDNRWKRLTVLAMLGILTASPFMWRSAVKSEYEKKIFQLDDAPYADTAIVFGAAVFRNGRLSTVLRDRVETAIALYKQGKVEQILMSGTGQGVNYDEPTAMANYAISRGVPAEDIFTDHRGFRTFETCLRAKYTFGVHDAALVTQSFHLPRALFTCDRLGIQTHGVSSDYRVYRASNWYEFRETFASLVALWDVVIIQSRSG